MLSQSSLERLERISNSLQSTQKLSLEFSSALEKSRKIKELPQYNEDGYSPFVHAISISPSNRIQIKIYPHFENRGKSSKQDDAAISAYEREYKIEQNGVVPRLGAEAIGTEGAPAPKVPLASLPNWHASKIAPFSPELEFQEWAELEQAIAARLASFESGNFSGVPDLPRAKQFTRLARRTILDAAGALEKDGYLPGDFQFFTGTLPGSTPAACEYFARYSRKFLHAMKTALGRLDLNLTFNCWEWQLRKKANLVPALHLHMVVVCTDRELAAKLPQYLEDMWFRLLIHYSAQSGVDFFEKHDKLGGGRWTREQLKKLSEREHNPLHTCKTIQCSKSVGAYLSKYVGKGSLSGDKDFQERFKKHSIPLYYPSSWWSVSDSIRQLIKKHTSAASFIGTMNQCMEAYHSLTSILEDDEYDLIELALPVFLPEWSNGNRIYRNMYCKSEQFQVCTELIATYSDNYVYDDGTPGNYQSNRSVYIPQIASSLRLKFELDKSGQLLSRLVRVLPFYCLHEGEINWDCTLTLEMAQNILLQDTAYPSLESLEDRISWQKYLESLSDEDRYNRSQIQIGQYLIS